MQSEARNKEEEYKKPLYGGFLQYYIRQSGIELLSSFSFLSTQAKIDDYIKIMLAGTYRDTVVLHLFGNY